MRGECTEAKMVEGQCHFPFHESGTVCHLLGGRWQGGCAFEEIVDVEKNCLQVISRLFEVAGSLEEAGLVVEDGGDEPPFDGLAASRSILQYLFCLVEVDCSFRVAFILDAETGFSVEFF